ncbi:MAG TPA: histidine--tRNA ligase [Chloroflexota bacterium]
MSRPAGTIARIPAAPPRALQGMRDFLPERMILRHWVIGQLRSVFESFGFEPLDTPAVEYAETLMGKYGQEADKLIYRFEDRGGRAVGLRYDLTVPLARVVAMYPELPKPFKRYQMGPVWRAERPQKGRYREFWQCDVDTVGTGSVLADAELPLVVATALGRLGFRQYTIRINNRKVLSALAETLGVEGEATLALFRSLDKLDKIGVGGVKAELSERGLSEEVSGRLFDFVATTGSNDDVLRGLRAHLGAHPRAAEGIAELEQIAAALSASGVPETSYRFDLSMIRGLDYYTGPIFETVVEEPKIGSLSGGGRYDGLIGLLSGRDVPATGTTVGLERIIDVIDDLGMAPTSLRRTVTEVLVTVFGPDTLPASLGLARDLRGAGLRAELALTGDRLGNQLKYASRRGIPFAAIVGPDEQAAGQVLVKNLGSGEQRSLARAAVAEELRRELANAASGPDG